MSGFEAQVYQNEYLPSGADTVDAVVTVKSLLGSGGYSSPVATERVQMILLDTSGSMSEEQGRKLWAAKQATEAAVNAMADGTWFALVGGNHGSYRIYPSSGLAKADSSTKAEAIYRLGSVRADGGTAIGSWIRTATELARTKPNSIAHAILLTDGHNEHEADSVLDDAVAQAVGHFQCDVRGLGANWQVQELRRIGSALLGSVDIIPDPDDMEAEFTRLTDQAKTRSVGSVDLRLWTPKGSVTQLVKQVAPSLEDLMATGRQTKPMTTDYSLGAWSPNEERDYHIRVQVPVGEVGDERLAARVGLVADGEEQPVALVRAVWTGDNVLSTRINREVAHYTGQAELADVIHDGLAARSRGDDDVATMKLGRAVQIAYESGNDETIKLLQNVVKVEDAGSGTIRLRRDVDKTAEMTLDVRSVRTVRVGKVD